MFYVLISKKLNFPLNRVLVYIHKNKDETSLIPSRQMIIIIIISTKNLSKQRYKVLYVDESTFQG